MSFLTFASWSEFIVYLTFMFFGLSIMLVSSAITAAPSFILNYYKYAQGDGDIEAQDPQFWANVMTYINVTIFGMQTVCELFMLTPLGRSIPLRPRLIVGLVIPLGEMLVLLLVPVRKASESGAKATIMIVAVMSGISKTICDSSTGALAAPFPTKFYNVVVWGIGLSGLVSSVMSVSIKASMTDDFDSVQTQSRIYFGLSMVLQLISGILLIVMPRNPFARKYIAEFRHMYEHNDGNARTDEEIPGDCIADEEKELSHDPYAAQPSGDDHRGNVFRAVGDADNMKDTDQVANITSTQQMLNAQVLTVFKCIWPMLLSCFVVYGATLLIFPGMYFAAGDSRGWYGTIIAAMFNTGDFLSRCFLLPKILRPSPRVVLAGSFLRLLVVPFLALCVWGVISGVVFPYILCLIWGLTNGYFGGMAMVHCTRTPSLSTAGQRSIASIMASLALLSGLFLGSSLALALMKGLPQ